MKRIAIVDSGIDKDLFDKKIVEHVDFVGGETDTTNNHGNLCCSALLSVNDDVEIYDIRILNEYNGCSTKILLDALEYLSYKEIDIINLSLTSNLVEYRQEYEAIIKKIMSSGKIIVASKANDNKVSLPASLKGVIGVTGNIFKSNTSFWYNETLDIQCVADKKPELLLSKKNVYEMFGGNSKATAVFTGLVGKYMDCYASKDYEAVQKMLMQKAERERWTHISEESFYIKDKEISGELLKKLISVVKTSLKLDLTDQELIYSKEKIIPGVNRTNAFLLIKNIEEVFNIRINYSSVNIFWFYSITNLYYMLEGNSNLKDVSKEL